MQMSAIKCYKFFSGELRYLAIPMAPSSGKELSRMPSVDFKNLMARWHERDTTIGEETRELVSKWERKVLAILVMRAKKAAEARHAREEEKQLLQRLKSHKSKSFLAKVDKVLKKQ